MPTFKICLYLVIIIFELDVEGDVLTPTKVSSKLLHSELACADEIKSVCNCNDGSISESLKSKKQFDA